MKMIFSTKSKAGTKIIDWQTNPHLLISGRTGSQKTTALENIMLHCMSNKPGSKNNSNMGMSAKLYLIDGKGSDLSTLRDEVPVAVTPNETARMLRTVCVDMHKRYENYSGDFGKTAADYVDDHGRHIRQVVIVVDELAVLLNESKTRSEIQKYLFELLVAARQASIYVAACWPQNT